MRDEAPHDLIRSVHIAVSFPFSVPFQVGDSYSLEPPNKHTFKVVSRRGSSKEKELLSWISRVVACDLSQP